ncbi:MAG: outer membrane beta-barrel protein [Bacteroidales bacterium]|nr:outer membrane beta-barrel protein [Bacteroidales bacterium]
MRKFFIILAVVLCVKISNAQEDTLKTTDKYIPIFENLQSDDRVEDGEEVETGIFNAHGHTFRVDDSTTQTDLLLLKLRHNYSAGKYPDALEAARKIAANSKLSNEENNYFLRYYIAVLKEAGYDKEADSMTVLFTKKYPFYKIKDEDPVSFQQLTENYYTRPRIGVWLSFGAIDPHISVDTIHIIGDTTKISPKYSEDESISFETGLQFYLTKYLSLSLASRYSKTKYTRNEEHEMTKFIYSETNKIISFPINAICTIPTKKEKWVPEFMLGAELNYIFSSKYEAATQYGENQQYAATKEKIDLKEKNKLNYSASLGARINFNYKRLTFFAEASASYTIKPFNNPKYNQNNKNLVFNQLYIPDAIHLAYLRTQMGIKINLWYKTVAKYGYGHF